MMRQNNVALALSVALMAITTSACSSDDPEPPPATERAPLFTCDETDLEEPTLAGPEWDSAIPAMTGIIPLRSEEPAIG